MESGELKRITSQFSLAEIERCISQQLEKSENSCTIIDETDKVITELSRATVIKELMDQGKSFPEALRELGKRIRAVYASEDRGKKP